MDTQLTIAEMDLVLANLGLATDAYLNGDFTGDGFVNADDVLVVVDRYGEPDPEAASYPCNDYTEPACNPSETVPGIQDCMRAAMCRSDKCHWAACIELNSGGTWFGWIGANLACGAVTDLELTGCLRKFIVP